MPVLGDLYEALIRYEPENVAVHLGLMQGKRRSGLQTVIGAFKKLEEAVKKKAAIIGLAGLFFLLLFFLTMFSSCGAVAGEISCRL